MAYTYSTMSYKTHDIFVQYTYTIHTMYTVQNMQQHNTVCTQKVYCMYVHMSAFSEGNEDKENNEEVCCNP